MRLEVARAHRPQTVISVCLRDVAGRTWLRTMGLVLFLILVARVCITVCGATSVYRHEALGYARDAMASGPAGRLAGDHLCPPLPPPTGSIVTVSSEADLREQAYSGAAGTTILIRPGVYHMQGYIHLANDGATLRGETGNRGDVILDFGGMTSGHFGIMVDADDVTIADLTIRNACDHGVSVQGRDRPILYNLHIQDTGDQLVKVNPAGDGSHDGLLACSRLEYSTSAPDSYTNGISAHNAHRWVVRDNEWYRIRTISDDPVPTILFWSGSSDTVVERNLLMDCYQGIAFGNSSHNSLDHTGGIVRNNFIYSSLVHDVAIEMVHAEGWLVAHNTAVLLNPTPGLSWGMEARFADSEGTFAYNLTNMAIFPDRDGAEGSLMGGITDAPMGWFVDPAAGDLHLLALATAAIDQAEALPEVRGDFDGDARPVGLAPDVGADEFSGSSGPAAVTDLRVTDAVSGAGVLTATLSWTPARDATAVILRSANEVINESNWTNATIVADTLPGDAAGFTAVLSYESGRLYFALKSQNVEGAWSALSNNGFWPQLGLYLPLVLRASSPPAPFHRIQPADLLCRGAFRLPESSYGPGWECGGSAMATIPMATLTGRPGGCCQRLIGVPRTSATAPRTSSAAPAATM